MAETKLQNILKSVNDMFMRYGIKSVTMDDIARHLGISKKTLYQYVKNKEELIMKTTEFHLTSEIEQVTSISQNANDAIDEMLQISALINNQLKKLNPSALYDMQKYYHGSWKLYEDYRIQTIYSFVSHNVQRGVREGLYRANLNVELIANYYIGLTDFCISDLFHGNKFTMSEIHSEFMNYHIHGIASNKGIDLLKTYVGVENE